MTSSPSQFPRRSIRPYIFIGVAFILGVVIMAGIAALLVNIESRKMEAAISPAQIAAIPEDTIDPAVWGRNFPRQYDAFMKTKDDTISTLYGGSVPYSKLERYPTVHRFFHTHLVRQTQHYPRHAPLGRHVGEQRYVWQSVEGHILRAQPC
ncbi:MAG: ammonia-forming cytochrome c nitrite reductase subunit c552 [Candidatus Roseilinea sp.]|uniref:ammonia-forming cytochrome c nitrite reductase subunit c552 n=1 Tax=Candidatus Roseilinea sp. TaxID=2838777 RepID=UPI00404A00B9